MAKTFALAASPCASRTMVEASSAAPSGIALPLKLALQFIAVKLCGTWRHIEPRQHPFFCTHAINITELSVHAPDDSIGHDSARRQNRPPAAQEQEGVLACFIAFSHASHGSAVVKREGWRTTLS